MLWQMVLELEQPNLFPFICAGTNRDLPSLFSPWARVCTFVPLCHALNHHGRLLDLPFVPCWLTARCHESFALRNHRDVNRNETKYRANSDCWSKYISFPDYHHFPGDPKYDFPNLQRERKYIWHLRIFGVTRVSISFLPRCERVKGFFFARLLTLPTTIFGIERGKLRKHPSDDDKIPLGEERKRKRERERERFVNLWHSFRTRSFRFFFSFFSFPAVIASSTQLKEKSVATASGGPWQIEREGGGSKKQKQLNLPSFIHPRGTQLDGSRTIDAPIWAHSRHI